VRVKEVVIPPWTPLKVMGREVQCWGRTHRLNGFGFWDSVKSQKNEVLAAPIRLRAYSGGKELKWELGKPSVTESVPHRVVAAATAKCSALRVENTVAFDYDGFMLCKLRLAPGDESIDRLSVEIPVKEAYATLFHAVGDVVRSTYAGFTPEGDGVVWDSRQANTTLLGNFVPFLWLGDEKVGLCWAAQWDRGWVVDDAEPAFEVVRSQGVVMLRANLIRKTVALTAPREIEFALQATPVKPLPKRWRGYTFFASAKNPRAFPFGKNFAIIGSSLNWKGLSGSGDVYPGRDTAADWARLTQMIRMWQEPATARSIAGLYTNARWRRVTTPDFEYYRDEWVCEPAVIPAKKDRNMACITPCESYTDMYLWYMRRMVTEAGVEVFYIDDTFLMPDENIQAGRAYLRDDGRLQPSCRMWEYRRLVKRLATMMHTLGRPPYIAIHMTTTALVPILSWATSQLDWEIGNRETAELDRMDYVPLSYIRCCSLGQRTGLVSYTIPVRARQSPGSDPALTRTGLALILLHGLTPIVHNDIQLVREYQRALQVLGRFGIDEPDCSFIPYWEDDPKVSVASLDPKTPLELRVSYYRRPGQCLFVVVNHSRQGGWVVLRVPDTRKLGLGLIYDFATLIDGEREEDLRLPFWRQRAAEKADGKTAPMKFHIRPRDYRLIVVGTTRWQLPAVAPLTGGR